MPPKPKKLPMEAVTMVLSAWRRDVELASALVSSSKFVGCIPSASGQPRDCEEKAQWVKLFLQNF
jgi:hypothetical protein